MVPETGIRYERGPQWRWGRGINGCALSGVDIGRFISVIEAPHSDFPLASFVGFQDNKTFT